MSAMPTAVMQSANTAIFERQLKTEQAIRFVMKLTGTGEESARRAIQDTLLWYRA
jgi:energy-coupling factor transporter ATP-binding protein EcfA2